ncbi:restriction endonuclease subunit S [Mameliella sp.]|uniref:restriction endonuclease subunit S n=1 Tax=Mameliella sp. TaxID=1924940 RepID=UPI003BACC069
MAKVTKKKGGESPQPYLGLEDIESSGTGTFHGTLEPQGDKSKTFQFNDKHVLYGRLRPYLNKVMLPDFEGHCSSEIFPLLPSQSLDRGFLFYWLTSDRTVEKINETSTGARMPRANVKEMLAFEIPLPPLEEQRQIVAVLDEAFASLSRARAHTEANLQNAQELFESHLFELFEHPDPAWDMAPLAKYCSRITVGHVGPMAKRYVDSGMPFLRSQNIRPFRVDLTDVKYIDEDFASELTKSELRPGDVAIVRTGYLGTCAVIPEDLEVANCADLVIATPGPKLLPDFMALLLNSDFGKKLVAGAAVGSAQKHFNVGSSKKAIFPIPPVEVQGVLIDEAQNFSDASESLATNYQS